MLSYLKFLLKWPPGHSIVNEIPNIRPKVKNWNIQLWSGSLYITHMSFSSAHQNVSMVLWDGDVFCSYRGWLCLFCNSVIDWSLMS